MKIVLIAISGILLCSCSLYPATNPTQQVKIVTPTPLATPMPSAMLPSPTLVLTLTPTSMPTATPTEPWIPTPFSDMNPQTIPSPDGKLVAKVYENYWRSFSLQVIEIQDLQGEVILSIPYQGTMPSGDPQPTMTIVGWSPDSSELFFYNSWSYDGAYTLFDGLSLEALDIKKGSFKDIVPGSGIAFSFSSDDNQIAYPRGNLVGIYNITTGEDKSVKIKSDKIEQAGNIHWSPSKSALVFTVMKDNETEKCRVIYLDVKTMKQKILLDDIFVESNNFVGWDLAENPQYMRFNHDIGSSELIVIDRKTSAVLVVGTPTPTPTDAP